MRSEPPTFDRKSPIPLAENAMTPPTTPPAPDDDGLVSHTEEKSPAEVRAYWTEERIAAARPVPMPTPDPPTASGEAEEGRDV